MIKEGKPAVPGPLPVDLREILAVGQFCAGQRIEKSQDSHHVTGFAEKVGESQLEQAGLFLVAG